MGFEDGRLLGDCLNAETKKQGNEGSRWARFTGFSVIHCKFT